MSTIVKFETSYAEPYPLQVVGEESYRDELEEVSGYTGEDEGVNADDFTAHLILDDNNIYDRGNAVAVEIDGKTVGYLSKPNAKKYRVRLKQLGLSDIIGECYASIRGGFIKRDGDQADFGVRLDLDIDTFKPYVPSPAKPTAAPQPIQPATTPPAVSLPPQTTKLSQKNIQKKLPFIPMNGKGWLYYLLGFIYMFHLTDYLLLLSLPKKRDSLASRFQGRLCKFRSNRNRQERRLDKYQHRTKCSVYLELSTCLIASQT